MLTILLLVLAFAVPAPESVAGLMQRAAVQIKQGNYKATEPVVAEILQRAPQASSAHDLLGLLRLGEGQFDQARQAFADVIRLNPGSAPAHVNLRDTLVRLKQDVQQPRDANQCLREVGVDASATRLIGFGQGGMPHAGAESHVVQAVAHQRLEIEKPGWP